VFVLNKESIFLVICGILFIFSSPVFATSFTATITPTNANMNGVMSVKFNFSVNNTNNSIQRNITEVNITWPSNLTFARYGGGDSSTSINSNRLLGGTYILDTSINTIKWVNSSWNGTIWSPYPEYFYINFSGLGNYNFTVNVKDSYGVWNSTNVSVNISGVILSGFPTTKEFGSSTVSITCSDYSNFSSGNITNITIRISNLTSYNQSSGSWGTVVWNNVVNVTNVLNIQNSTSRSFTLTGNYSDYYKYVVRCEANDTGGANYTTPNISFLVSLRNFSGYVRNSTGSNLNLANVSIYRFDMQQMGPPAETLVSSILTGSDGNFSLTNVNTTRTCIPVDNYPNDTVAPMQCSEPQFRIKIVYPNESNANQTGPTLPAFPRSTIFGPDQIYQCPLGAPPEMICGPPKLNGSTIYTQAAAVFNLNAKNFTGDSVNFGYEVFDKSQGFPIASCVRCNSTSANVVLPIGRNYTVMFVRDPQMFQPPDGDWSQCGNISQLGCPTPPISNSSVTSLNAGDVIIFNQSLVINQYNLTGCINVTGNNSAINITKVVPRLVPWPGFVPPMKAEMEGGFNISDTNDLNYSDYRCPGSFAYYRLDVMGSTSPGIEYFIEFYGKNASSDSENPGNYVSVAAFKNVTITSDKSLNFTLKPLAGLYATGGDVNTSKVSINLFKNTNNKTACTVADNVNCFVLSNPHIEIEVKDSNIYNGDAFHYTVESISNGNFNISFLNTSTVKLTIFDQSTSPSKKTLNLSQNNINTTVFSFMPDKILPNGTKVEFNKTGECMMQNIRFYRSGGSCDVYNPPESCALEGGNFSVGEFNPMKAMLAGKVNLRLTTPNVTLYFINVDLIASGPPEPDRSESAMSETRGASSLQMAWRFGSMAPRIYDYVLIGINDSSINSSWSYNISIPALFGENISATAVWSLSAGDSISNVPDDYTDYNATGSAYADFLSSSGKTCSFSDSTSVCYTNSTSKQFWLKIPHFSGVQPTVAGAAPATTTATTTSGGGSAGGGTTTPSAYIKLAKGKVNITMSSLTTTGKLIANIARYEDVAIRGMNITVINNVANIKITITKIAILPSTIPYDISGMVYHYITIEKTNMTDSDIKNVSIGFAVNKTWLTNNNVAASNVTLYRWANDKWNDLGATKTGEDDREIFYNTVSPGLSVFIIGAKGAVVPAPTGAAITCIESWTCTDWSVCTGGTQTRICTDTNACGIIVNKPVESQTCEVTQGEVKPVISWISYTVAAVIVIAIAVVMFIFRSKITPTISRLTSKLSKKKQYVYKKP
jgi:PGF-pre-PGF domain-containing protein